ncbi:MAG: hypothetical protein R3C09_22295 [Pirellulaceae bacterium]
MMLRISAADWKRLVRVVPLFFLCILAIGCTPRVIVRAHPQPSDRGIRFYRPKPYLKVEPAEVAIDKNQTSIVPGVVRISLVYMPDFSEEFAIDVRSGLGIANVGIKLQDGWNLTEISQELDSQTDENTKAFASLLSAVGDVVPTSSGADRTATPSFTVPARNVPIGFYESIIGLDARGCKRLYGFRYVGFVPFSGCPLNMGGSQSACCDDPNSGLYGLSFVDGQMVFLPLDEMAHAAAIPATPNSNGPTAKSTQAHDADLSSEAAVGLPAQPLSLPLTVEQLRGIEVQLRAQLTNIFDSIGEVRAVSMGDRIQVRIHVPAAIPPLPIQRAAQAWLQDNLDTSQAFDVELSN